MQAISTSNAEHYTWGDGCDGWHLVRTASLSVIEERMSAGAAERRHVHRKAQQFFYVLAGELTMESEDEVAVLAAGQGLTLRPGIAHKARNGSTMEVRFLVISEPPSHGDRVET